MDRLKLLREVAPQTVFLIITMVGIATMPRAVDMLFAQDISVAHDALQRTKVPSDPAVPKPLSDAMKLKLRDAQYDFDQLQLQYVAIMNQKVALEQKAQEQLKAINTAQDEAFKESGADKAAYTLDPKTLTFVRISKPTALPAAAAPTPASGGGGGSK